MSDSLSWFEVYIGLGSNLETPQQQILSAVDEIAALSSVRDLVLSPLYGSQPVGPQDQPDYVNAVLRFSTAMSAILLLENLQKIENDHARVRNQRWGARTLDLDILLYGNEIINQPTLRVPHPELSRRAFVLYPLADVADANLAIPGLAALDELISACPREGLWRL
jgi:2-amino-4-hydroxy-6-hydroxymethyldihydropteridine diphosphokinase